MEGFEHKGPYAGTKIALFIGRRLVVLHRDDNADIPWPDYLDLPGGGREGDESPEDCIIRETGEEIGLWLTRDQLSYKHAYERPNGWDWFFAAHLPEGADADIRFGDEGQGWFLMRPEAFIASAVAVPYFRDQLRVYLER